MNNFLKLILIFLSMFILPFAFQFSDTNIRIVVTLINIIMFFLLINIFRINRKSRVVFLILISIFTIIVIIDVKSLLGITGQIRRFDNNFFILPARLSLISLYIITPFFMGTLSILQTYDVINSSYYVIPIHMIILILAFIKPKNIQLPTKILKILNKSNEKPDNF